MFSNVDWKPSGVPFLRCAVEREAELRHRVTIENHLAGIKIRRESHRRGRASAHSERHHYLPKVAYRRDRDGGCPLVGVRVNRTIEIDLIPFGSRLRRCGESFWAN